MVYNPKVHHRRSIRLRGYDYSQAGAYFVTICTQNHECLFGKIVDREMRLNVAGEMVERWYSELTNKFLDIECDEFVCMPNHVHFIAVNVGADRCVRPGSVPRQTRGEHIGSPLHRVVQWFKTMSTNEYIRGVKQNGWRPFAAKLWQRNYWEHIVRNEQEMNRIQEYIQNNPAQWEMDKLNPDYAETEPRVVAANVGADLRVHPDNDDEGQTLRSAPTEIREPSVIYGYFAAHPDREGWMV